MNLLRLPVSVKEAFVEYRFMGEGSLLVCTFTLLNKNYSVGRHGNGGRRVGYVET